MTILEVIPVRVPHPILLRAVMSARQLGQCVFRIGKVGGQVLNHSNHICCDGQASYQPDCIKEWQRRQQGVPLNQHNCMWTITIHPWVHLTHSGYEELTSWFINARQPVFPSVLGQIIAFIKLHYNSGAFKNTQWEIYYNYHSCVFLTCHIKSKESLKSQKR